MGWTPVVRRRKKSNSSGNLNVMMDLNKEEAWCGTIRWKGFLEFMSVDICKLRDRQQ